MNKVSALLLLLLMIPWSFVVAQTAPLAPCSVTDIDMDDNGLIDICDLEGLNAIRYQLDGTGYRVSTDTTKITDGCPSTGCNGYELIRDLDFQDDGSYRDATANQEDWTVADYSNPLDQGWLPIGTSDMPFNAEFDGNSYKISNLAINREIRWHVALFDTTQRGTTIHNIVLSNVTIIGGNRVGSLVGTNFGYITNVHVDGGSIEGNSDVGGLVGGHIGIVEASSVDSRVAGKNNVGGLVGKQDRLFVSGRSPDPDIISRIINSRASGNVSARENYVGGLIGRSEGHIENSHARGNVEGRYFVGGLVGYTESIIVSTSYAPLNVIHFVTDSSAVGSVKGEQAVGGLVGYSEGVTITKSYAGGNVEGTQRVGGLVGGLFGIVGDRAIQGTVTYSSADGDVKGEHGVGGLVGWAMSRGNVVNNYIANSYASGDVEGITDVGGLVGDRQGGDIINSYASGNIKGRQYTGGLAGSIAFGNIINSHARGNVIGFGNTGGLVGWQVWSDITNSYASGNVEGDEQIGGLVGRLNSAVSLDDGSGTVTNRGTVMNSYASGRVVGKQYVGGLIGWVVVGLSIPENEQPNTVANSYASGSVEGNLRAGGLVGDNYMGKISNSYWNKTNNPTRMSVAGTSKTSVELRSATVPGSTTTDVYYEWDTKHWEFGTLAQYPAVKYAKVSYAGNPTCAPAADSPDCGTLLPNQYIGLSYMSVTGDLILSQAFNSEVFNYRVVSDTHLTHIRLIPTAANSSASIVIRSSEGFIEQVISGTTSSEIPLSANGATRITVEVSAPNEQPLRYILDINDRVFKEGEYILLDGSTNLETDIDATTFRWRQIAGTSLLPSAVEQAVLDIRIPEDFVERASINSEITLRLIIRKQGVSTRKNISLTIVKINNGTPPIDPSITLQNNTLVAPMIDLSGDPDGIGVLNENSYQWQRRAATNADWSDIIGNTMNTYMVPEDTPTYTEYRVRFSYTDGQGYTQFLRSEAFVFAPDIDKDDDGLIEITYLEDLHAMRYQPDGSGYRVSAETSKTTVGCRIGGCNGYELVRDLDFNNKGSYRSVAVNKSAWTTGSGWQPIGSSDTPFNSIFNADGNTISNLRISRPAEESVGLFGVTADNAEINGVGLLNVGVVGGIGVGGLVGDNKGGVISDSYVTGRITGKGRYDTGGLVGWNLDGTIVTSYSDSIVAGSGTNTGGLVGKNDDGTVTDSYAAGHVAGNEKTGGLVGTNNKGTIAQSYATARVDGSGAVGGLVGENKDVILNSHTTASVFGGADVGGLVGWNSGDITNSYAITRVEGNNEVGGFIGNNLRGTITNSYARGDVVGVNRYIGGFIGWSARGMIINSYAHGSVSGKAYIGGFIGVNVGQFNSTTVGVIDKSYAIGSVSGNNEVGGFAGDNRQDATITNSYWNKTNNPTKTSAGGTSQTTAELQSPVEPGNNPSEAYYEWNTDDWDFAPNDQYPAIKYTSGAEGTACGGALQPECGQLLPGQRSEDVDPNKPPQGMRTITIMLRVLLEGLLE